MKFYVIGIDDNREQEFPKEVADIICSHSVFSGGVRHREIVCSFLPPDYHWIDITVPLNEVFKHYTDYPEIVVFASGDPLFFGFANTIQKEMPDAEMIVYPSFNSLQLLAHRLLIPYQDMHIVSLTGRPWDKLDEALIGGCAKIGVLTDRKEHTPANIARRMLYYGYDNYTMSVGELLGNRQKEKVSVWELKDIVDKTFSFPNNLILQKTYTRYRPFGIPENQFHLLDGRVKMITKMPVRLVSLSLLDLRDRTTLWDIGSCTGSVSVEAKLQFPHLRIIAFEKRKEGKKLLENNCRKFGAAGIQMITGDFTETDITGLPKPDAAFIGGHGGRMEEIIRKISTVLQAGGSIVFNSVSEESSRLFKESVEKCNFNLEKSIDIQVDDFNKIEIMKAIKTA